MDAAARRQPKGLYFLLLAELCERFAFYTLVFQLALYLTEARGFGDSAADLLYGGFTAFVYLMTVVGGLVADRWLGYRQAIVVGGLVSTAGFVLLFVGDDLYLGLAALITGTGLFKVNITSLLGCLYRQHDEHQESGFSLYYMGINAGSFAASLGSGYVASRFGYQWAFAMAGIGELLAVAVFLVGRGYLQGEGMVPAGTAISRSADRHLPRLLAIVVGSIGATGLIGLLLLEPGAAGAGLTGFGLLALAYFIFEMRREHREQQHKLVALLLLFIFAVVFWAVYGQSGLSVILYIQRSVDREILGHARAAASFESLNPIFVLLTAPVFSWLWIHLARKHLNPSIPAKFLLGLILLGSAFFVLKLGGATTPSESLVPPIWLVAFFFLLTCGEMCVSPVGLSIVSHLTPRRLLGFGMGMWFLAESVANYLSGIVAQIAAVAPGTAAFETRSIYESAFVDYGALALAGAVALLPLLALIRRLMGRSGGDDTDERRQSSDRPSGSKASSEQGPR
jgi:proton-dependent oligopeptide transporter, POT family